MYFYFKDVHISIYFGHATKFRSLLLRQCGTLFNILSFDLQEFRPSDKNQEGVSS